MTNDTTAKLIAAEARIRRLEDLLRAERENSALLVAQLCEATGQDPKNWSLRGQVVTWAADCLLLAKEIASKPSANLRESLKRSLANLAGAVQVAHVHNVAVRTAQGLGG